MLARGRQFHQLVGPSVEGREPAPERKVEPVSNGLGPDGTVERQRVSDALQRPLAEHFELEESVDQVMRVG